MSAPFSPVKQLKVCWSDSDWIKECWKILLGLFPHSRPILHVGGPDGLRTLRCLTLQAWRETSLSHSEAWQGYSPCHSPSNNMQVYAVQGPRCSTRWRIQISRITTLMWCRCFLSSPAGFKNIIEYPKIIKKIIKNHQKSTSPWVSYAILSLLPRFYQRNYNRHATASSFGSLNDLLHVEDRQDDTGSAVEPCWIPWKSNEKLLLLDLWWPMKLDNYI